MQKGLNTVILGGTFNPIHNGHIHAVREVMERLSPDAAVLMPAGIPPHKRVENEKELRRHRYEMTKLAVMDEPRFFVSDIELKNEGISYTVDTLDTFIKLYAPKSLSLILGTDMFLSFEKWKSYDKILNMCGLIVLPRFKGGILEIEQKRDGEFSKWRKRIQVIDAQVIEISSTKIRETVRAGGSIDEFVPKRVAQYIYDNKLYR
ncbi:MAG: nicotinate (nicotinamide) nucleotide adenylyltransferase [Clostridia bacterium]|nr:nicotinate (nicotinamide) nucleotide adenylyltransferase [Clostridia bacterium]